MNRTLIVGIGGFCRQIEYHYSQWEDEPSPIFFDNTVNIKEYNGYEVINTLDYLSKDITHFVIADSNPQHRKRLTQMCLSLGLLERNIITVDINIPYSSFTKMSKNCIILRYSLIEPNVSIGYGCLLNTRVSLHHDVKLGEYVTISPNATILGNVEVGNNSFIGAGSIIREKTKIGNNCIVGMGSVVLKDITDDEVWVGNPARYLRKNS